jgi:hypothetical protein
MIYGVQATDLGIIINGLYAEQIQKTRTALLNAIMALAREGGEQSESIVYLASLVQELEFGEGSVDGVPVQNGLVEASEKEPMQSTKTVYVLNQREWQNFAAHYGIKR